MNKRRLDPYLPVGLDIDGQLRAFCAVLLSAFVFSLRFIPDYLDARSELFINVVNEAGEFEKVLFPGAQMPGFFRLLGFSLAGFGLAALWMCGLAVRFYVYHYQGSRSIFLMKRLPQKGELYRRCFAVPLAGLLLCLLAAGLLIAVYYAVYLIFTPAAALPGRSFL